MTRHTIASVPVSHDTQAFRCFNGLCTEGARTHQKNNHHPPTKRCQSLWIGCSHVLKAITRFHFAANFVGVRGGVHGHIVPTEALTFGNRTHHFDAVG